MAIIQVAAFNIGQAVRHRMFDFGGIIEDVDAVFAGTEAWYEAIPEASRPDRNQPFYHVQVNTDDGEAHAYVSQQNLLADADNCFTDAARQAEAMATAHDSAAYAH